jgi:DNA repair protein RecO (recombination protein O)
LHQLRYNDKSLICRVFTAEFGLKTFLIRIGTNPKKSVLPLLQPMNVVEFDSKLKESGAMNTLKDLRLAVHYTDVPFNPVKSAIALFMDEVLYKTIHDDYQNVDLYQLIVKAMLLLDQEEDVRNFPIWFLLELSKEYGFYPQRNGEEDAIFDLKEGVFYPKNVPCPQALGIEASAALLDMVEEDYETVRNVRHPAAVRLALLEGLMQYLQIHLENLRNIRSLSILHEVFHSA